MSVGEFSKEEGKWRRRRQWVGLKKRENKKERRKEEEGEKEWAQAHGKKGNE